MMNFWGNWIQSKVFRDFGKIDFMNSKIIIPISIIIIITIIAFSLTQNENTEEKTSTQFKETEKIDSMLEKIEDDKIKNELSENPFVPKEREWITSGPFKIDRSEYLLGEKIFVNIDALNVNEKGRVVFLKPINNTHYSPYHIMPFDGLHQRNNYYFTPDLSIARSICNTDELVGNWKVVFEGTKYSDLEFKVIKKILPGNEKRYESIC